MNFFVCALQQSFVGWPSGRMKNPTFHQPNRKNMAPTTSVNYQTHPESMVGMKSVRVCTACRVDSPSFRVL